MRIVFLGTSHGVPEPDRKCSSTLIEVGNSRYIIDMGTQSIEQLIVRRIPIESVKCIFATHMHGDHTNGIISYLDLCSWYFKEAQPTVFMPEPVEEAVAAIKAWLKCNGTELGDYTFKPVNEGLIYEDKDIKVTAFKTKHIERSYAFLVEAEGKRVLFSGDLSHNGPQDDFPVSVLDEPLDLAVCESAHVAATQYLPIFKDCKNLKQLCFNHYYEPFIPSVIEMKSLLPDIPVMRAADGMEIVL